MTDEWIRFDNFSKVVESLPDANVLINYSPNQQISFAFPIPYPTFASLFGFFA